MTALRQPRPGKPNGMRIKPFSRWTLAVSLLGSALASILVAALMLLVSPAGPARAQWGDAYDAPRGDPYYAPPRRRLRDRYQDDGYGYGGRATARRYAPPPQEAPRQFYWPWEDRPQQAQPPAARPPSSAEPGRASRPRPSPPSARTSRKRSVPPAPSVAAPKPAEPKTAPTTQVAVFGDSLASYLRRGLDEAFSDNPNVAIVDRSRGDSGLVRKDVVDWPKAAEDWLKANSGSSYALVMVGVNDRQPIREGDQSYDPLSDKWREIYGARVDALIKAFTDRKVPLIWVGLPPVRSESLTTDFTAINDLVRERVQKAGQSFVEIWQGFVDERNRYVASGPDVDGQEARLRTSDGVHFTSAGARKVAHFADVELKRIMGANGTLTPEQAAPVAAVPGTSAPASTGVSLDDTSALDRKITAMLPPLPEPPGIPSLPVKPTAGPVVPLGRVETSPGGLLITGRPREGDATGTVERSLQRGAAPMPQPGRADDFKWPPS
ncbi:hypothetical protein LKMONMHP_1206 [Methylobacterium organophilum]|uniref:SGNH hydrolase-type esterase domain-containing protein n=2 Tax=Methylobacterium organophilum TaxID=410 RepID=A0ABQ4T3Y5_METOR|nr:hypothetical protein LKMONMHP_1206 [Methylobacterium organophilum]